MEWHHRSGFGSEDSDDEMVIYRRTERQFYRKLRQEHGEDTTLLQKRELLPFERLMLHYLGGKSLLNNLMGKDIGNDIQFVYDYLPTKERYDFERPTFFQVKDRKQFTAVYQIESNLQTAAMQGDEDRVRRSVFANELKEVYELIRRVIRSEPDVDIYVAAANCLPVHGQAYFYVNMNEQEIVERQEEV